MIQILLCKMLKFHWINFVLDKVRNLIYNIFKRLQPVNLRGNYKMPIDYVDALARYERNDLLPINNDVRLIRPFGRPMMVYRAFDEVMAGINSTKRPLIENGPPYWNKLLSSVSEIFETRCFIGGGAIRDFLLDIPPKDIDIFVNPCKDTDIEGLKTQCEELGWGPAHQVKGSGYDGKEREGMDALSVFDLRPSSSPWTLQLIFVKGDVENYVQDVVSRFDLDICKSAYYNGDNGPEMFDSDPAQTDRNNKTITYSLEGPPLNKSIQRAKRIQARFKEFGLEFKCKKLSPPRKKKEEGQKMSLSSFEKIEKAKRFAKLYGMDGKKVLVDNPFNERPEW